MAVIAFLTFHIHDFLFGIKLNESKDTNFIKIFIWILGQCPMNIQSTMVLVIPVLSITNQTTCENLNCYEIFIIQKQGEKVKSFGLYAFNVNFIMIGTLVCYQIL
jgi:hypothetical protein